MRKAARDKRREKLADLARRDRANRCVICKRNLTEVGRSFESLAAEGRFCSRDCLEEAAVAEYHAGGHEPGDGGR